MKDRIAALVVGAGALLVAPAAAFAQATPEAMMAQCRARAAQTLGARLPDIETKYEGQRTDGTHAVNGTVRAGGRERTFQCSFGPGGNRIVRFVAAPPAQGEIRKERVQFEQGLNYAVRSGTIRGYETVDYMLNAQAGQRMIVRVLRKTNGAFFFNVLPPGSETALYVGSESARPDTWSGMLPASGDYTVRVYLMRNAARRREAANYAVQMTILGARPNDALVPGTHYHATGSVRCSVGRPTHNRQCNFGVVRGAQGSASVHITKIGGGERIINFHGGNATTPQPGRLTWGKANDVWSIGIDGREFYVIPDSVVVGG
jgi:hypothetical protein